MILSNPRVLSNFLYCFFTISVCAFNHLPNGEYSNLLTVAAFSNKFFFLTVRNSYLLKFIDYKAEILAVCLSV